MKRIFRKPRNLTVKFMLGMGIILFCTVSIASAFFYEYLKDLFIKETYQKTDLVLGHIDATMEYVRDEMRPHMFHVLPKNDFVVEAMSTSFVNKGIMRRFTVRFPDYIYRRVAIDPMNPENRADAFERKFILKFSGKRGNEAMWKGLSARNGREYFIHLKAVVMEKQCVTCHGDPAYSPRPLVQRYGKRHGHYWKVGDVVGLESVAIPVEETFYQIRRVAFSIFLSGLLGMVVLFMSLNYFYYVVAVRPLKKVSSFFKSIVSGQKELDVRFDAKGQDEITGVAESFNQLVSHLRKSQDELRASESKYRRIFEGSKDAIIVTDCLGTVTDINYSGVELFGCSRKDDFIKNISMYDFFAGEERLDDFLGRMERDGFVKDFEAVFRKKDAGEIPVLITATFRKDEHNDICGYECIVKDITERKRMEQHMRQADKLASAGRLAAGVAHEINNPLSIILGYTGMLMKDRPEGQIREDLGVIYNNSQLCKKIVEDLLNFSRQTKPQYVQANINETVESVVGVMEGKFAGKGAAVIREYDPSVPQVTIDTDKMKQVFMNLLMNAYQAVESGGTVTISTRYDIPMEGVLITFSDTGCGIPGAIQNRIFEPFFTTKEPGQGTGLGLAVSYGIIKEHNGEISFEGGEGKGATFRIWLPLERG